MAAAAKLELRGLASAFCCHCVMIVVISTKLVGTVNLTMQPSKGNVVVLGALQLIRWIIGDGGMLKMRLVLIQ